MFETTGALNEALLKELSGFLVGRRKKRWLVIACIALAIWGVICLLGRFYAGTVVAAAGVAVLLVNYRYVRKQIVQTSLLRAAEMGIRMEEMETTVLFDASGAVVQDRSKPEEAPKRLEYGLFEDFAETKSLFVLVTRGRLMVTVFKDQLSAEQQAEFKQFLQEKPTHIKKRLIR